MRFGKIKSKNIPLVAVLRLLVIWHECQFSLPNFQGLLQNTSIVYNIFFAKLLISVLHLMLVSTTGHLYESNMMALWWPYYQDWLFLADKRNKLLTLTQRTIKTEAPVGDTK